MKLRSKIQLIFGGTLIVSLVMVGFVSVKSNVGIAKKSAQSNMENAVTLSAGQISSDLDNYLKMAVVAGQDAVLTDPKMDSQKKVDVMNQYATNYGFTSGNILDAQGVSLKDGTDFSDREYVQRALAGEANISEITLSKYTNTYGFSIAAPMRDTQGAVVGVVYFRADIDFMQDIISRIKVSDNSYAFIVDGTGMLIVDQNEEQINQLNLMEQGGQIAEAVQKGIQGETGTTTLSWNGIDQMFGYGPIAGTDGWVLMVDAPESDFMQDSYHVIKILLAGDLFFIIFAVVVSSLLAGTISKAVKQVEEVLLALSEGDFSKKLARSKSKDELGILTNATVSLNHTLTQIISETNGVLGAMANCNLATIDMKNYPGEFNKLAESVNSIKATLTGLMKQIQDMADSVGVGSSELADASNLLSEGTMVQATSIQRVVEEIENIAEGIRSNSQNEALVNTRLQSLDDQIKKSNQEMTQLMSVVKEIESMSNDIQKIVGTIDSIAFQTNILALNAAVEAARAGEKGKGFAVVADEVGSLASKCGEASKQTEELVGNCICSINRALECAERTFESLTAIVEDSEKISMAFEEISEDTKNQAGKSENIKTEMMSISDVVQTNTATAEETAASTGILSSQADSLRDIVNQFKLHKER